jgi:hypothetical protein
MNNTLYVIFINFSDSIDFFSDPSITEVGDKRPVQQNIKSLVQLFHNFSII